MTTQPPSEPDPVQPSPNPVQPDATTPPPVTPVSGAAAGAAATPGIEPAGEGRTFGMLAHLLGIFTWFVGALVIWLIKKDSSRFVDDQGKEALNFQITLAIGWVGAGIISVIPLIGWCVGWMLMVAIAVINLIFCIMGTVKANEGIAYRYPFAIRLIK